MMNFDIFGAARGKDFALRRSHFLDVVEDAFVLNLVGTSAGGDG
jgi:hypothetical protein